MKVDELQDECVVHILSFLKIADLCALSSVSQRFHGLSEDTSLWRHHCCVLDHLSFATDKQRYIHQLYTHKREKWNWYLFGLSTKFNVDEKQDKMKHFFSTNHKNIISLPSHPTTITFDEYMMLSLGGSFLLEGVEVRVWFDSDTLFVSKESWKKIFGILQLSKVNDLVYEIKGGWVNTQRLDRLMKSLATSEQAELSPMESLLWILQASSQFKVRSLFWKIITIVYGNLLDEYVDVVVKPSNATLLGQGSYVARALLGAGGPKLIQACKDLGPCDTIGECKVSEGFELLARHVIHLYGSTVLDEARDYDGTLLKYCYNEVLKCATANEFQTISIPALGTGGGGYDVRLASEMAVIQVVFFLMRHWEKFCERCKCGLPCERRGEDGGVCQIPLKEVRIVCFEKDVFRKFLETMLLVLGSHFNDLCKTYKHLQ